LLLRGNDGDPLFQPTRPSIGLAGAEIREAKHLDDTHSEIIGPTGSTGTRSAPYNLVLSSGIGYMIAIKSAG